MEKFLKKSKNNNEAGIWAEEKEYFDIAVNRRYYEIYQLIIFISKKCDFNVKPKKSEYSHNNTILNFIQGIHAKKKLSPEHLSWLNKIFKLSMQRCLSDYDARILEKSNDYENCFKKDYTYVKRALDYILNTI